MPTSSAKAPTPTPMKRAAFEAQRRDLDPLITRAEIAVHAAYDQARRDIMPVLDAFAQAYQAEYDRLNKDLDDDEEPHKVTHAWLVSSGWLVKVKDALKHAADQASAHCERTVLQSHQQAAQLGEAHGKALIKAAMQPGVDAYVQAMMAGTLKRKKHHHHKARHSG